jgi:iron(III) transport system substrate-binding protein
MAIFSKSCLRLIKLTLMTILILSCQKQDSAESKEFWIYTSLYKDTIADLTPRLEKQFPGVKFQWYQAGSEDIATKVGAELMAGLPKADLLISSDRFWYEDLANQGKLFAYSSPFTESIAAELKHPQGFYTTLSIPVMVISYNQDALKQTPPQSFKELTEARWKDLVSSGSPLASGTNFTTMAFLQKTYGWDYFKQLKSNGMIAEGGNSAVVRRLQSGERPVGKVLLENILRFQNEDKRLKFIIPSDGAVIHNNVLAITQKENDKELVKKVVDWFYSKEGQEAMTRSFMYSPIKGFPAPVGAPELEAILAKSFPWSSSFLKEVGDKRTELKEKFAEIMFH